MKLGLKHVPIALASLVITFASHRTSPACDVPVYQYAMARWVASPYKVYFFHDGQRRKPDQRVRDEIDRLSKNPMAKANLVHVPVHVGNRNDLASLPKAIRNALNERRGRMPPHYMVASPSSVIFSGQVVPDEVNRLVDSRVRRQIVRQLFSGNAAVFVLLRGKNAKANAVAELQVAQTLKAINEGQIVLRTAPKDQKPRPKDKLKPKPPFSFGSIKLSRDDEKEEWLVRMLLAMEPDLKEKQFEDQAMLFCVFARGRVLKPYIGGGISRANLIECGEFVTGPCACKTKDENPGVELLLRANWEMVPGANGKVAP